MGKSEDTYKITVRLSPLTEFRLERDRHLDGSRSKNEFIERAIVHYMDRLEAEQSETLPRAIQSSIDGRLGMFEDRIAKLMFKQTVETDMALSALLDYLNVDPDYMRKLRADSVKNVKATNGRLSFEQKASDKRDYYEDELWLD